MVHYMKESTKIFDDSQEMVQYVLNTKKEKNVCRIFSPLCKSFFTYTKINLTERNNTGH